MGGGVWGGVGSLGFFLSLVVIFFFKTSSPWAGTREAYLGLSVFFARCISTV